jgi:hypothetical protein
LVKLRPGRDPVVSAALPKAEVNRGRLIRFVISIDAPKTKIRKSVQVDLAVQRLMRKYALAPTGKSVVPLRASRA